MRAPVLGILARSRKPAERRLPIHPLHLERIDQALRDRIVLESGYGKQFGFSDQRLGSLVGAFRLEGGTGSRAARLGAAEPALALPER